MTETRKTEQRYTTSDPARMLNKYLVHDLMRKWTEEFLDEDTGTVVPVERSETLYTAGTLITQDVLAAIRFHMEAGDIQEVEVSNQQRMGFEYKSTYPHTWTVQAEVGDRKQKFLLHATGLQNALEAVKDYAELHYKGGFTFTAAKKFDVAVVLVDTLKKFTRDDAALAYLKDEMDAAEYMKKEAADDGDDKASAEGMKFYQVDAKIHDAQSEGSEWEHSFIVHTCNVDRAMMTINAYLKEQEERTCQKYAEHGQEYAKRDLQASIEQVKVVPVSRFIPDDFASAYFD